MATLKADIQNTRWSDSMERSILNQTLSNGEAVSFKDVITTISGTIKKVATTFGNKIIKLSESIYEARLKDGRLHSGIYY